MHSLDANQAQRQLLEEGQHVATLDLTADGHISLRIDAVNLAMSRPIVVTVCMGSSCLYADHSC